MENPIVKTGVKALGTAAFGGAISYGLGRTDEVQIMNMQGREFIVDAALLAAESVVGCVVGGYALGTVERMLGVPKTMQNLSQKAVPGVITGASHALTKTYLSNADNGMLPEFALGTTAKVIGDSVASYWTA